MELDFMEKMLLKYLVEKEIKSLEDLVKSFKPTTLPATEHELEVFKGLLEKLYR